MRGREGVQQGRGVMMCGGSSLHPPKCVTSFGAIAIYEGRATETRQSPPWEGGKGGDKGGEG